MPKVRFHASFEGLGAIESWLSNHECELTVTKLFHGEALPAIGALDWLIVMGGPMGVHDHALYPWLPAEKQFISEVITAGICVLGVCLGAQLIAHSLGGEVRPNGHKEIGWMPVTAMPLVTNEKEMGWVAAIMPEVLMTFHWHGDTFSLPPGALHLAASSACRHQAFVFQDNVVALQFHPEMTAMGISALLTHCAEDIKPGPYVQSPEQLLAKSEYLDANRIFLEELLAGLEMRARRRITASSR
jgi:GMP synthase-like glutamine amidotransferase